MSGIENIPLSFSKKARYKAKEQELGPGWIPIILNREIGLAFLLNIYFDFI